MDALLTTRDGIVGRWSPPVDDDGEPVTPRQLAAESTANLPAWEAWVRERVFAFEIASRLGFTAAPAAEGSTDRQISLWHLKMTTPSNAPPTAAYVPLARFDRPSTAVFREQIAFLRAYADLRPDRGVEIAEQLSSPVPFLASIAYLRPDTRRWTAMLLEMALELARMASQRVKHGMACRRPNEYSPQIQPMILTPAHSALPSGHATEAFTAALVLWRLLREAGDPYLDKGLGPQLLRLASRIAVNRTVAGVHFPIDSVAGSLLGMTLADYFLARCGAGGVRRYQPAHFNGKAAPIGGRDFRWDQIYDPLARAVRFHQTGSDTHPAVLAWSGPIDLAGDAPSEPLEWLWVKARAEWT